ncbi:MAG: hypothetical protein U5R06_17510 [candidate division KSB1 bacterium]|nr:hypothetical protein [candidate division KSB1 bacterium]
MDISLHEERNSTVFFSELADSTGNSKLQKLAAEIGEQDKEHEIELARLRDALEEQVEDGFIPEEEATFDENHLNTLFPNEDSALSIASSVSDREALTYAIKTEKNSINLCEKLKPELDEQYFHVIEGIIGDKKEHIQRLETLRKEYI